MTKVTKKMITSFSKFKSEWEKDAGKPGNSIMCYLYNCSGQWKLIEYSLICTGLQKTPAEEGDF